MVSGIRSKSDNDRHSSLCLPRTDHHHLLHTLCVHKTLFFFFLVYYCFSVLSATATVGISPHLHIIGHLQYPDGYFVIRITLLLLLPCSSWSSGSLTTMARNADEMTKDGSQTTKKSEKRTRDLMATTFTNTANGTLNNSPADVNPFWNSQPRQARTFPTCHRIHFCLPK